jgi:hypothetical protein
VTVAAPSTVGAGTAAIAATVAGETVTLPPVRTDGAGTAAIAATVAGGARASAFVVGAGTVTIDTTVAGVGRAAASTVGAGTAATAATVAGVGVAAAAVAGAGTAATPTTVAGVAVALVPPAAAFSSMALPMYWELVVHDAVAVVSKVSERHWYSAPETGELNEPSSNSVQSVRNVVASVARWSHADIGRLSVAPAAARVIDPDVPVPFVVTPWTAARSAVATVRSAPSTSNAMM